MTFRSSVLRIAAAALSLFLMASARSDAAFFSTLSRHRPKPQVLAFYYTWYGTPSVTGAWRHWDEGGHHPDRLAPNGMLDTGTTDHPPALYDSMDPDVIRRQLAEARRAGLDGLISTWWGRDDYHERAFARLLDEAAAELRSGTPAGRRAGMRPVYATLYYEQIPAGAGDPAVAVADDFLYLLKRYGGNPAFYRYKGKPVLFVYGRAVAEMSGDQWREALAKVKAQAPVYVVGDGVDPDGYNVFDSLHEYNPVGVVVGKTDMAARDRRLVENARARRRPAVLTVIPGYDDSHIGQTRPTIARREGGRLYLRLWDAALDARPDWILITSFNEWHEGSEIEPSREYGDRFLRLTSEESDLFHSGRSIVPAEGQPAPAALPKGWEIAPRPGTRLVWEALSGGGVAVEGRTGRPGRLSARIPGGSEPYVFEEGREGRLWRTIAPSESAPPAYGYSAPSSGRLEIWPGSAFAANHSESPFAGLAGLGLHLDLTSGWPGPEADEWLVYPDGAFPLNVTLRNAGKKILEAGTAELWAPEEWGHSHRPLFDHLAPGKSAAAILAVRPSPQASLDQAVPAFAWIHLRDPDRGPVSFQSSVDLLPVRPIQATFRFGERGAFTLHLQSRFPGRPLAGSVTLRPAEGRKAVEASAAFRVTDGVDLPLHQQVPANEAPALRRTYATISVGSYRQLAAAIDTATVALGAEADETGVRWIDGEDGRTEAVRTGPLAPARRAVPNAPGAPHYMYFGVTEGMPRAGDTHVEVDYLDEGSGRLSLQYDSTDAAAPLDGRYKEAGSIAMAGTGTWKQYVWKLADARFAGRQNFGADFRLAFGPESRVVRRVTVSKWPR